GMEKISRNQPRGARPTEHLNMHGRIRSSIPVWRKREHQRSRRQRILLALGALLCTLALFVVAGMVVIAVVYNQIASQLTPRLEALKDHQSFQSSRLYDRNGTLLYEFVGEGRRVVVPVSAVSHDLINATISIEDASFYQNSGVDYLGILRAVYQNLTSQ